MRPGLHDTATPSSLRIGWGRYGARQMISYEVEAKPTFYRGVKYRSRLEAKWAAFFTIMKWPFEYEPFDLGKWSPDFLLHGKNQPILAEVKPIHAFDAEIADKMATAANKAAFVGELLLVGTAPLFGLGQSDGFVWDGAAIGWLGEGCFDYACVGTFSTAPEIGFDFCHQTNSYHGRMSGFHEGNACTGDEDGVRKAWIKGSNDVQWLAGRSKGLTNEIWRAFQ